ncbi:TetR/AcrR family transcriptional regulator [Janthinobacterium sp. Mn2066]|uniref:TetR/AcrR family transcriptional regulator n=1 Tax=Janthinobacterium sp. Mn2066 TaxID=3395264 RepID=UPI003BD30D78
MERKSDTTRAAIVERALALASQEGLEALSLGPLADAMKMSKSGVFTRFGSRSTLQMAVLKTYHGQFQRRVLQPALAARQGLPRLRALFASSLEHIGSPQLAGCFYFSCAAEYDDRPGPLRHELTSGVLAWRALFEQSVRQAVELGQLAASANTEQMVFEIYALLLAVQHDTRLLERSGSAAQAQQAFEHILQRHT